MASMGPVQRYESLYMGADEFLNQRVNEELQRAVEVFLVRIQVIDLYQPKLRFHLHLHNKELEIQLHSCLWGRVQ